MPCGLCRFSHGERLFILEPGQLFYTLIDSCHADHEHKKLHDRLVDLQCRQQAHDVEKGRDFAVCKLVRACTHDDRYAPAPEESPDAERPASVAAKAEALLREWLEKEQPLYARDFYGIADSEGLSKMTVNRVKKKLGLRTVKSEKGWIWTY